MLTFAWLGRDPLLLGLTAEEFTWTTPSRNWNRQTQPVAGYCAAALVPTSSAAAQVWRQLTPVPTSQDPWTADGVMLNRRRSFAFRVQSNEGGWTPVEFELEPRQEPMVSLTVDGVSTGWFQPQGPSLRALVNLPRGAASISLRVENAADWTEGPAVRIRGARAGSALRLPTAARWLSSGGTLATWTHEGSPIVATTLKSAAIPLNALKTDRILGALCANLGMAFRVPEAPRSVPLPMVEFKVESGAYNTVQAEGVELRSAGSAVARVRVQRAGLFQAEIAAESTPFAGGYAEFALEVGGREVDRLTAGSATPKTYLTRAFRLPEGVHEVRIRFLNDASGGGEDRNLWIRSIGFLSAP